MESQFTRIVIAICIAATLLLAGCATPPAPNFHGHWKPVNRYAATTTQIPLAKTYMFFATPVDGTLKTMLSRWSKDTGIKLSYELGADYTLTDQVAQVNTSNIYLAASQLNAIYTAQGIKVVVSDWNIEVRPNAEVAPVSPDVGTKKSTSAGGKTP